MVVRVRGRGVLPVCLAYFEPFLPAFFDDLFAVTDVVVKAIGTFLAVWPTSKFALSLGLRFLDCASNLTVGLGALGRVYVFALLLFVA